MAIFGGKRLVNIPTRCPTCRDEDAGSESNDEEQILRSGGFHEWFEGKGRYKRQCCMRQRTSVPQFRSRKDETKRCCAIVMIELKFFGNNVVYGLAHYRTLYSVYTCMESAEVINYYSIALVDVYLLGTVMLVFGMGLYELFVSNLDSSKSLSMEKLPYASNLFGLFTLKERPKWLDVKTVNELKTKIGHVIVMLLLIGLYDKSKKAIIQSPVDLLCFSASVLLSSGSLFLLSKLKDSN
ncbi:hypothetical protein FCV25MIE_28828 [Fagus crenata]